MLIVGSGSITHNLRALFASRPRIDAPAPAWVTDFTDWAQVEAFAGSLRERVKARFATMADLRSRKMLRAEDTALVVGKKDGQFVYFNGQQFALLAAPTRSGKGVGIVIPNLLSYQGSVVVLDIKQENFDLTSGWRQSIGHEVYLFNPFAWEL